MTGMSARARCTFSDAFEKAVSTFEAGEAADFFTTSISDVYKESLRIEERLAAKRCMRNMRRLKPFFEGIERYSKSIEVLCNGTPFLPWIWARLYTCLSKALY